ncbi:uncharacterized protein LOC130637033 [Hydractinia symbiolongicarpus]|uniref:uncharacterized protein LOC130637033 n=1 Tax=Hydractinia symbiolongicarpus TaxID=13093 RepID=UPI00255187EB|nr:uncharacterized protein LOC130637033 [Hydractinia symbiolongicarpus]
MINSTTEDTWCFGYTVIFLATEEGRSNLIAFSIVSIFACFFIITLNSLYIFIVLCRKTFRQTVNQLYLLLSTADMMSGIALLFVYINLLHGFLKRNPPCFIIKIWTIIGHAYFFMSISAVGFISIEAYIAVFKPFMYRRITKKSILTICLLISWIPSVVLSMTSLFESSVFMLMLRCVTVVYGTSIFTTMLFCHRRVYVYIRENNNSCSEQKKKAASVALQVLVVCGLFNIPAGLAIILKALFPDSAAVDTYVRRWCVFLVCTNGLWDTFIYGFRSSAVRRELIEFCNLFTRGTSRSIATSVEVIT